MTLTESPTRTTTAIAARTVAATKVYGRGDQAVTALDDVDLEIPGGRFTAVMGPSGSGQVDADALPRRARLAHVRGRCTSATPSSARSTTAR